MSIALIDADILIYRIGFTTQDDSIGIACARMETALFTSILAPLNTEKFACFLTSEDKSNFRYSLSPTYKANRKDFVKPRHYNVLRDYLTYDHGATIVFGEEADDRIGIEATRLGSEAVVVSIDKDLKQIPGTHYHFVNDVLYTITPEEGLKFFYTQLLTGDKPVDNIDGLYGIGPKTAAKLLKDKTSEEDLFSTVQSKYKEFHPSDWEERMLLAGRLLKIRQQEGELWNFPNLNQNSKSESLVSSKM